MRSDYSEIKEFEKAFSCLARELFLASDAFSWNELFHLFCLKFSPQKRDLGQYQKLRKKITGAPLIDMIDKTNFFTKTRKALSLRCSGSLLALSSHTFSPLPYAVFYVFEDGYYGFHIRFQDISRGGLRTVFASQKAQPSFLSECYELAATQHQKNKDIPEGGAKAILFVHDENKGEEAQMGFTAALLQLVASPLEEEIIDYYGKEEILYLGPDEHILTSTIDRIADYALGVGYRPGRAFMTSKSAFGINHKQYGVTSWGVTVCLDKVLGLIGLPQDSCFTVKMTGGPDGDVAGNQILNLRRYYSDRACLIALRDSSGLIFDPEGIDLAACETLFHNVQGIASYPSEKLHEGGFLLESADFRFREKISGKVVTSQKREKEARLLLTSFIHKQPADIFIPAGGRPRTLDEHTIGDFFANGIPTACAIIEGANLYLSEKARLLLEEKGVVIIKDSSANKGGVICSSWEVIAGLVLRDEEFIALKEELVTEIFDRIRLAVSEEVDALFHLHAETGKNFSTCSDEISKRILTESRTFLKQETARPWNDEDEQFFIDYMLPIFRTKFRDRLHDAIPETHRRAIVAKQRAAHLVYHLAAATTIR